MPTASAPILSDVAACVFDAYGTLYDFNSAAARCRDALGDKAEALSALWRQKQISYALLRSLMGTHAPFSQVTAEALDHAMEALGISNDPLRAKLLDLYRTLDAFPEVPGVLAALKTKGLRLAILSNGSPDMLAAAAQHSGLDKLLEASLSVESVGIYKPSRRVYALANAHFGVPAKRIAFFSSNGWDAHGAAQFGFQTVWVNRGGLPRDRLPGTIRHECRSLADLPALFGF